MCDLTLIEQTHWRWLSNRIASAAPLWHCAAVPGLRLRWSLESNVVSTLWHPSPQHARSCNSPILTMPCAEAPRENGLEAESDLGSNINWKMIIVSSWRTVILSSCAQPSLLLVLAAYPCVPSQALHNAWTFHGSFSLSHLASATSHDCSNLLRHHHGHSMSDYSTALYWRPFLLAKAHKARPVYCKVSTNHLLYQECDLQKHARLAPLLAWRSIT